MPPDPFEGLGVRSLGLFDIQDADLFEDEFDQFCEHLTEDRADMIEEVEELTAQLRDIEL